MAVKRIAAIFFVLLLAVNCKKEAAVDYEQAMVDFVVGIADSAHARNPDFGIFPQNGSALGSHPEYLAAVTGIGQEDVYFGYDGDGIATPSSVTAELETNLDVFHNAGKLVLAIDYPFPADSAQPVFDSLTRAKIDSCFNRAAAKGYLSYPAVRALDCLVVSPGNEPAANIPPVTSWSDVKEFAYQLQPSTGTSRQEHLEALAQSKFDLVVIDYSFDGSDGQAFTKSEITALKQTLGGKIVAYLSIGEAENYRWYWQEGWDANHDGTPDAVAPDWLDNQNPDWLGNYKVRYWQQGWQNIIFQYLDKIIAAGFDGVYLDIIDAYEYFAQE
jgi:cysteinyl-tRNA synthetase